MNKDLARLVSKHSEGVTIYGDQDETIYFKNGSAIKTIKSKDFCRGKRSNLIYYIDLFENLKWWQKLYIKYMPFKSIWFRRR